MDALKKNKCVNRPEFSVLLSIFVVCAVISAINPTFFSYASAITIARAAMVTVLFALCEMLIMISGGIDVSFPAVATAGMYATTIIMKKYGVDSMWTGFLIAALIGGVLGAINAVLVAIFHIPPLIATLGMSSLVNGTMLAVLGSGQISIIPDCMERLYKTNLFVTMGGDGLSYPMNILLLLPFICSVVFAVILKFTMFGRSVYAIGGDIISARRIGINTTVVQFSVYLISGVISGVAGLSHAVLMRVADATTLMGSEMMVIAACVVGGVRITGGHGSVLGTILGVILLEIVSTNLITVGISPYWQTFVVGMFIIVGTCVQFLRNRK